MRQKGRIENILKKGKENAITSRNLVILAGYRSVRDLQKQIAKEREAGAVICSGTDGGYWLPKNRKEIEEFCNMMDERAKKIFLATRSAKRALEIPEGQQNIET